MRFLKIVPLCLWGLFACLFCANAQERAILEKLVSDKVISQLEADAIKKQMPIVVEGSGEAQKVNVFGMVQVQYNMMESKMGDSYSESFDGFYLRRIFLGAQGEISDTLSGYVRLDFVRKNTNNSDYLLDAYITKKIDYDFLKGTLQFGIKKVQFGYEEVIPCDKLSSIETSLATRYFAYSERIDGRLGFGQRYVGVFWNGEVKQIKGLKYNFAVTNAINNSITPRAHLSGKDSNPESANAVNLWFAADYTANITDDSTLRIGVKTGFGNKANVAQNSAGDTIYGTIMGIDPFFEFKYKDEFILWAEYLCASVQHGRDEGSRQAVPQGYNAQAEYIVDIGDYGRLGFVIRGSQLFSNGRGISIKDSINYCQDPSTTLVSKVLFDQASSIYAGITWYIRGDYMKFQAGYEWSRFDTPIRNVVDSDHGDVNCVRAQVQILF